MSQMLAQAFEIKSKHADFLERMCACPGGRELKAPSENLKSSGIT